MAQNATKAQIATVKLGSIEIDGLMYPNGDFGIAIPQIFDLTVYSEEEIPELEARIEANGGINTTRNQYSRTLNRICGESFNTTKGSTEISRAAVLSVNITDFEKILAKLDRKGFIKAQNLRDDLVGLSVYQLFCDAFGVKFEGDDRQKWLKARMEGKVARRTLTDAMKDYFIKFNISKYEHSYIYAQVSDILNVGIFGRKSRQLKVQWETNSVRDAMTDQELKYVEQVEDLAVRLMDDEKYEPRLAVYEALDRLIIPKITRQNGVYSSH